ncbi:hypothetical protein GCM10009837_81660 [Streptomyces durmitorensis]
MDTALVQVRLFVRAPVCVIPHLPCVAVGVDVCHMPVPVEGADHRVRVDLLVQLLQIGVLRVRGHSGPQLGGERYRPLGLPVDHLMLPDVLPQQHVAPEVLLGEYRLGSVRAGEHAKEVFVAGKDVPGDVVDVARLARHGFHRHLPGRVDVRAGQRILRVGRLVTDGIDVERDPLPLLQLQDVGDPVEELRCGRRHFAAFELRVGPLGHVEELSDLSLRETWGTAATTGAGRPAQA